MLDIYHKTNWIVGMLALCVCNVHAQVLINEILYDPEPVTAGIEFIELHNAGAGAADVGGWRFTQGVEYTLPPGTSIPAGGFLVVAQNPSAMTAEFGIAALGPWVGKLSNDGETIMLRDAVGNKVDELDYQRGFPWPICPDGQSMELINSNLDRSLGGSWRSSGNPGGSAISSPGLQNRAYRGESPPSSRQVEHTPKQPVSGEPVVITAKVTDPEGVQSVVLEYQVVDPGAYVRAIDAAYDAGWSTLPMLDDASGGDVLAGDDVYTAVIPPEHQLHRSLVRYRITVADTTGLSQRVPYEDDLSRNFSYFTYDGVPAWSGADQPGTTSAATFPTNVMENSLPVYHLLAQEDDVMKCQYNSSYKEIRFYGTLVYDGNVYDHIQFRVRGEYSTYRSGKNKWRFYFNRADHFQARDNYGEKYKTKFRRLNFNACASPWIPVNRGMAGLDEAFSYRIHELAGVQSSKTHFTHFRIIDRAEETSPTDQYEGDLWGLYLSVEHIDGRFLDERDLPDGNTYKIAGSSGIKKNQGPTQSEDSSDWNAFRNTTSTSSSVEWWRGNFDLPSYYAFRGINRVVSNVDLRDGSNFGMYHHPDGHWYVLPQDLDMMFPPETHWSGTVEMKDCLARPEIENEFRNHCRKIMDLMLSDPSPTGGQAVQLIHDISQWTNPSGAAQTFADVDRFMWNYHPRTASNHRGQFCVTPKNGSLQGGAWTRTLASADYEGFMQYVADFITDTDPDGFSVGDGDQRGYGFNYLEQEASDSAIPFKPTIAYTGTDGYPVDGLRFESSVFADPQGSGTFGALEWRLAEVRNSASPGYVVGERWKYEMDALWESGEILTQDYSVDIPPLNLKAGHTYRVRVRHKDNSNRWSHYSDPVEFVALGISGHTSLMLTEVHYNPGAPPAGSPYYSDEFEFVEFKNTGTQPLNLHGYGLDGGIEFSFTTGAVGTLQPGEYGVVVRNLAAFASRYSTTGMHIAGEYSGKLSNSGENVRLEYYGQKIFDIAFNDARGWPPAADGGGHSLIPINDRIGTQGYDILDYPGNWRASTYIGGSPGAADPDPLVGPVINELVAHTDTGLDPPFDSNDRIELYNPTAAPIVLDGHWFLSDDLSEPEKWNIPLGTTIPAGGWVAFSEDDFHPDRTVGFGLDKAGERVVLSYRGGGTAARVVDCVEFEGQANGESWGRFPDGNAYWQPLDPTVGAANQLLNPGIRIQELMYHPQPVAGHDAEAELEYILLTNRASHAVSFSSPDTPYTWRLGSGVEYAFAPDVSLAAGESLWLVPFDPVLEPGKKTFFCSIYRLDAGSARLLGPYSGELSNSGERVVLERPQASDDPLLPDDISWIIVDEVIWLDEAPWPNKADGSGLSLVRVGSAGNDPLSWATAHDIDKDGLPDAWERTYRPNLTDLGMGDFDGDGFSDGEEYIAGTHPSDPNSIFKIEGCDPLDGEGMILYWQSVSGRVYNVYWSSNLTDSALLLASDLAYPTGSHTDRVHQAEPVGFYSIDVQTNAVPIL